MAQNNDPQLSINDVLHEISESKSWSDHQIRLLANCSVQDFIAVFKNTKGRRLSSYIDACLNFEKLTPLKDNYHKISNIARLALTEIAKETPLNQSRLSKFGIQIDESQNN